MIHVLEAIPLPDYRLKLVFDDQSAGEVDVSSQLTFTGVFAPLADPAFFAQVRIEDGTVTWPNGADLDPYVLYSLVTGAPLPGQGDWPVSAAS